MTNDWQTALGYPIEFIPLSNPYDLHPGHTLQIKLVWQGEPLADQLVYIHSESESHDHDHDHETVHDHDQEHTAGSEDHQHHSGTQVRTDSSGHLSMNLTSMGKWYLRTIKLAHSDEPGLTHESHWATLTFEVGHGHSHTHVQEAHSHDDSPEQGIPSYVFWIGSLLLIAGLFFYFNRKN